MNKCLLTACLILIPFQLASADITVKNASQVTLGASGETPNGSSGSPILAPNGQYSVFRSDAPNLVANDTNSVNDVFVSNLTTGLISRLSISATGIQGNNTSTNPSISVIGSDGFYAVTFESDATNLGLATNSTGFRDILVRIPSLNITEVVSQGISRSTANDDSVSPSIAYLPLSNKLRIVFASDATNLVSLDQNSNRDIYLAEITIPSSSSYDPNNFVSITRITNGTSGFGSNGASDKPKISGNGEFIVFQSSATDLVSGVTGTNQQIYSYEIASQKFNLISRASDGTTPGNDDSTLPTISYNGRFVSFLTDATNIISGISVNKTRVIRFDSKTSLSSLVSSTSLGVAGNDSARDNSISSSGRFVTFSDASTNLISDDTNNRVDVFIKDVDTGDISRISKSSSGEANANSDSTSSASTSFNSLSSLVSYRSFATNITSTTSGAGDIFLSSADLEALKFAKGTQLEVPPDITAAKKKAIISGQQFNGFDSANSTSRLFRAQSQGATDVRYEFQIDSVPSKKKFRQKIIAKRNRITVRKFKPGTYVGKYRVLAVKGSKTVTKSPFSPKMQFKIS